ncbi:MAG: Holliday junction resolvase RuvX [Bacteroidota bacterium]
MPRILAIDYGLKRTGLAWTDPLQIIATGLDTVATEQLAAKLDQLMQSQEIEAIVLGYPTRTDGSDTHATEAVRNLHQRLKTSYPALTIHLWDERFTSRIAKQTLLESGASRKKRRQKGLIDQISATLILQEFMQSR